MPNIKSAKKRVKVIATKAARNKSLRSDMRTALKKAELALENGSEDRVVLTRTAMKKVDSAVTKGILHKNAAARKKSSLATKLNSAG